MKTIRSCPPHPDCPDVRRRWRGIGLVLLALGTFGCSADADPGGEADASPSHSDAGSDTAADTGPVVCEPTIVSCWEPVATLSAAPRDVRQLGDHLYLHTSDQSCRVITIGATEAANATPHCLTMDPVTARRPGLAVVGDQLVAMQPDGRNIALFYGDPASDGTVGFAALETITIPEAAEGFDFEVIDQADLGGTRGCTLYWPGTLARPTSPHRIPLVCFDAADGEGGPAVSPGELVVPEEPTRAQFATLESLGGYGYTAGTIGDQLIVQVAVTPDDTSDTLRQHWIATWDDAAGAITGEWSALPVEAGESLLWTTPLGAWTARSGSQQAVWQVRPLEDGSLGAATLIPTVPEGGVMKGGVMIGATTAAAWGARGAELLRATVSDSAD